MPSFANFSRHAFKRVAQRTSLSCNEIAAILDRGLVVNTGQRPGFNRVHLVFYSHLDNEYFVAIQDIATGTVITILPLDYHETLAWGISAADCERAREIFLGAQTAMEEPRVRDAPKIFVISGNFLDEDGRQKTKILLKIPCDPYGNDLKKLLDANMLFQAIEESASAKGIPTERMFAISVRHGKRGLPVTFDLRYVASC